MPSLNEKVTNLIEYNNRLKESYHYLTEAELDIKTYKEQITVLSKGIEETITKEIGIPETKFVIKTTSYGNGIDWFDLIMWDTIVTTDQLQRLSVLVGSDGTYKETSKDDVATIISFQLGGLLL